MMIALAKELENAGFSKDVSNSVLRFSKNAANCINNVYEGECDDVLTLVNIDYFEYEGEEGSTNTNAILTFADKDGKEFSIEIETEEEWKNGEHWSEDKLLKRNEYFSLLN